jgi:putative ABC transport system ATP-binding protein
MPLEYTTRSDLRRIRYSSDEQKELAKQVLVRVGLGDRLYHKSNELSGGQRQRVAIARALINNPPVILADEPTGNLDSRSADQIMQLFMSLLEEGRTVVMVTHNLEFLPYTSRHIVMRDGRVVDDQRLK